MITYDKIKALNPCYDPNKFIPETYQGTALDILKMKNIPAKDRLWVVVRVDFLTDKQIQAYALACARLSEKYATDSRVKECNDVVERYLKGEASEEELATAESAAHAAALSAAHAAARSAADSAARSAAWSAAHAAARSAADSAAWSAARSAADSAAWSAAWSAADSAARSAAHAAYVAHAAYAAHAAARSAAHAAWSAAWSAADSAAWSAAHAAWDTARTATEEQQALALIKILEKT